MKISSQKWLAIWGAVAALVLTAATALIVDAQGKSGLSARLVHFGPRAESASNAELERYAWRLLRTQISNPREPLWEKWSTKCSVNPQLMDCVEKAMRDSSLQQASSSPCDQHPLELERNVRTDSLRNLFGSVEVPVQDRVDKTGSFFTLSPDHMQEEPLRLASVLFNPEALQSVQSAVDSWSHGKMKVKVKPCSILAKAIWTRVPASPNGKSLKLSPLYIYRPHDQSGGMPPQMLTLHDDFESVAIDSALIPNDSACARPDGAAVSPDCFHYHFFNNAAKAGVAGSMTEPGSEFQPTQCDRSSCYFVLVGIHFMMRLDPEHYPKIYKSDRPWLFITLFWTGQDNGVIKQTPWKYYQIRVAQEERGDKPGVKVNQPLFCSNPYLEGTKANGAVSNCVSCHQFARVAPRGKNDSLITDGVGECLGSRPYPLPQNWENDVSRRMCTPQSESDYDRRGVPSDFVWSLARLNEPKN